MATNTVRRGGQAVLYSTLTFIIFLHPMRPARQAGRTQESITDNI